MYNLDGALIIRTYKPASAFLLKVDWSLVSYRFIRPSVFAAAALKRSGLTSILYNSTAGPTGLCALLLPFQLQHERAHTHTERETSARAHTHRERDERARTHTHTERRARAHTHTHANTLSQSHTYTNFKRLTNAIAGIAFPKEHRSIDSWKIWSGGQIKDNESSITGSKRLYLVRCIK